MSSNPKTILILAANPTNTVQLALDEEVREIKQALERSNMRDRFEIVSVGAVRPDDLRRTMLNYEPQIVHFSGHGIEQGLALENESGKAQLVGTETLADLFELFVGRIECVLLNACYSEVQAEEIVKHINYVVGMSEDIRDRSARKFAVGFYEALFAGRSFEDAYRFGCNAIDLNSIPGSSIPIIKKRIPDDLYIERPPIESNCYQEILKPGALIRIKAPRLMGKTSLSQKIISYAAQQGYRTVHLNLRLAERGDFASLNMFLQWFCAIVGKKLKLPNQLEERWDEQFANSKVNCMDYFEEYLLAEADSPIVLCLDDADLIFPYQEISEGFFSLLRVWHEAAKINDIWKRLRLIVVHSTEASIRLNINESPFNVGLSVRLSELNDEQVRYLLGSHGLDWAEAEVGQLIDMLGGHPDLLQRALSYLKSHQDTLEQFLEAAPTEKGIYDAHLQRLWKRLEEDPELIRALTRVLADRELAGQEGRLTGKLYSMGLVKRSGNKCIARCNLYRQFFSVCLGIEG